MFDNISHGEGDLLDLLGVGKQSVSYGITYAAAFTIVSASAEEGSSPPLTEITVELSKLLKDKFNLDEEKISFACGFIIGNIITQSPIWLFTIMGVTYERSHAKEDLEGLDAMTTVKLIADLFHGRSK